VPRPWLAPALALLLIAPAPAGADPETERAVDAALRDWSHAIGTAGYAYGAPLLELAIAEYRQGAGLDSDLAGPRGVLAHAMGGRLATHATAWHAAPDPDVLVSSAWLDLEREPWVLFVPPLESRWYSVRVVDAYGDLAGSLSPRSHGSVGGWHVIAHAGFEGPAPPRVQGELRSATHGVRVIVEVAATRKDEASVHERIQSRFKLLPLGIYRRSPAAAEFANAQPQSGGPPPLRALPEMRGQLEAFRVINQRLRRLEPPPAEQALLALFDRAGFGPHAVFDPARLAAPELAGLRDAARDVRRALDALRRERTTRPGWHAAATPAAADALRRAARPLGAAPREDVLVLEAHRDGDGRRLDGRSDYRIRFRPGARPPAEAFWTLAAYSAESERLFETGTDRFSVGRPAEGLHADADGGLEVWISSDAPDDARLGANWLPVRHEPFFLVARLRAPAPAALDGSWSMPPVEPAD